MPKTTSKTTLRGWIAAALFGTTVLAGSALAVQALHARAATEDTVAARPALTVQVAVLSLVDRYSVQERFVGRVEPARQTLPAAERAGLVTELLVDEGEMVRAGQVLARLDVRPLEIERARLIAERASVEANIELANRTADRRARLADEGWTSTQTYDEARFAATALGAQRDALTAAIARVDLDLEKSVIQAPFDGQIARRMIDEGAVVAAGTALMRLQETGRPQARVGVPADRADALQIGQALQLDYQGRSIAGRIAAITRDLQAGTRTVPVLIDLIADRPLAMGQIVRLSLTRDVAAAGAWVPLTALQEAERGLWSLMTVTGTEGAETVRREAVEILHLDGARAFVRGTFADGALIVPSGAHRLSTGQRVAADRDI